VTCANAVTGSVAMSAHVILKGAEWVLSAERAAQAPAALYVAQCLVCQAESAVVDNDPKPAGVWAIEHARRTGRDHCQFRVTTEKHWRVDPTPPAAGTTVTTPPRPRSHARPRARRLRRALAHTGPLALAALVVAVVFIGCGYLLGAATGTGTG
jgi:hypothetical protein